MTDSIIRHDIASLLDGWIEAERKGVEFPVPFDAAWRIAEYSNKANAKQSGLKSLKKGIQFSCEIMKTPGGGRSSELINLSVDGFKHFCLMADTEGGEATRQYFIESEKKWKLVQQVAPELAQEVELMHLKIELAKVETQKVVAEAQKAIAESQRDSFRHLVINTMPEIAQQKILGYELVEKIEYRDRIIQDNQVLDEGNTVNKTELCDRYNIKTRSGSADYKRLNALLDGANLPRGAWEEATTIRSNLQLRREYLENLDRYIIGSTRQLHVGEK